MKGLATLVLVAAAVCVIAGVLGIGAILRLLVYRASHPVDPKERRPWW